MSACSRARRALEQRFEQELSWERNSWLEDHLEDCPRCASQEARSWRLEQGLESLPTPAVDRLDLDRLRDGIRQRIEYGESAGDGGPRRTMVPLFIASAAALVIALVYGTRLWRVEGPSKAVEPYVAVADEEPEQAATPLPPVVDDESSFPRAVLKPGEGAGEEATRAQAELLAWLEGEATGETPVWQTLQAQGWPVERMTVRWLESKPELAPAGIDLLRSQGSSAAKDALVRLMDRSDLREAVAEAAVNWGSWAQPIWARAAWDPELEPRLLAWLEAQDAAEAARSARELLQQARSAEIESSSNVVTTLLAKVAGGDAEHVGWMLSRDAHERLGAEAIGRAIRHLPGAGERLRVAWDEASRSRQRDLLHVLGSAPVEGGLDLIAEALQQRSLRGDAWDAWASYQGLEPLALLHEWHEQGLLSGRDFSTQLRRSLLDNPDGCIALAEGWSHFHRTPRQDEVLTDSQLTWAGVPAWPGLALGDSYQAGELLDAALELEDGRMVPTVLALSDCLLLRAEDRERGLLAAAEVARKEDAPSFADAFAKHSLRDLDAAAVCLLTVQQLAGLSGVEQAWSQALSGAFSGATPNPSTGSPLPASLHELLRDAQGPGSALTRLRLARELRADPSVRGTLNSIDDL